MDGEEGVLLDIDLSHTNSSRSITFNEYYETSISSDIDPATFQIQQVTLLPYKVRKFRTPERNAFILTFE